MYVNSINTAVLHWLDTTGIPWCISYVEQVYTHVINYSKT